MRGSEIAALRERKRSEAAIFETPRDNRITKPVDKKVQSSLFNIAGMLKMSKNITH